MLSESDGEEEYNEDMNKHKVHVVEIIGRVNSDLIPARGSNVLVMEVNGDFQDIGKEVPAGSIESEINYEHLKDGENTMEGGDGKVPAEPPEK